MEDSIEEPVIVENVSTVEESIEPSSHVEPKRTSTETNIEEKVEQLEDEEVPEEEVAMDRTTTSSTYNRRKRGDHCRENYRTRAYESKICNLWLL